MTDLLQFIHHFQTLDAKTEEAIQNCFIKEFFPKNEFLLKKGQVCKKIQFISSGLVRRFYLADEIESTKWLYHDRHWSASMASYFNQQPSCEYFQACEDTTVYSLSYPDEQALLKYPLFLNFHVQFLRRSIASFDEFHFIFGQLPAREKYLYLLEKFPLIIQRAKLKHIASLLNISQEALSRIRASIILCKVKKTLLTYSNLCNSFAIHNMISKNTTIGKNCLLGKNVKIGNHCTIENDVIIGNNSIIDNNVSILNGARIGSNCHIHSGTVLAGVPQDMKYKGEYTTLEIGNGNIIRESVTINKGTQSKKITRIGNNNLIMANAHIGHDCEIGNNCIIGFSVGIAGEVIVNDFANISGLTGIHQFTRIGEHCMIGGLSKVVKDVPPFIMAAREPLSYAGINIVGLKRRGFDSLKIYELQEIYRIVFQQRHATSFAIKYLEDNFKQTIVRDQIIVFIRESQRGIIKGFTA
ncbi:MAG: acyl-ACP--UDP-N-acetylglucosamine O-acyltransferase [Draconibacterium sp.]